MNAARRARLAGWLIVAALSAILVGLVARALLSWSAPAACSALAARRIVRVFAVDRTFLRCERVQIESPPESVLRALSGRDPAALADALRAHKGSAVALATGSRARGLAQQLAALAHLAGLRAALLSPELAVYAPVREIALSEAEREALAYVARALFRGAREPNIASFPPALRRVERVEVMVMLSQGGDPRLWRSARGTSIARALLTATRVARDRWREREQAMGGPLSQKLLGLDVEVSLLSEDGTLLDVQRAFVDRAITPAHGLGFDHRTAWHYQLPRDLARKPGGPFELLLAQIRDQGLSPAILAESDTRLYRFVVTPLGFSRAPLAGGAHLQREPAERE